MKFTYWSGNKIELENELRSREEYIENFAKRLGLNTDAIKVMFNYKDQTNKSKIVRFKDLAENSMVGRASIMEHKNGTIDFRINDKVMSKRIVSKISAIPQLAENQFEFGADIECDALMSQIAYLGVVKSEAYKSMESSLSEDVVEPLVPIFIASFIKTKENFNNIKMVSDPYSYEDVTMTEDDWSDLFDICNYHRLSKGVGFAEAVRDRYPNRINSMLNNIVSKLEDYLETYIESGGVQ